MTATAHPSPGAAAQAWTRDLAAWRIPDDILAVAPQSPWIHPVEQFLITDAPIADTPSHVRARERLADGGTVLDVGCGGGRAAFAVSPPATSVIGVDHQDGMLTAFADAAERRGLAHTEVLGDWPQVKDSTPVADAVACHHVVYNVADLTAFVTALSTHARRRVVLELPQHHPLAGMTPLWRHFWDLERPDGPTATDALAVVREAGFDAELEPWLENPATRGLQEVTPERQAEFMRIRLCLPAARQAEVADVLATLPVAPRHLATIWWDTDR